MAVGSLGGDDGVATNGPGIGGDGTPLTEGQSVEYWSTSKSKWIEATVKAVDDQGAVQLSVKPNVWVSGLEQVAKVTVPPQTPAPSSGAAPAPPASAPAPAPPASAKAAAQAGAPVVEMLTATGQPNKSRELFSLFAEWDAKQHRDSRPVCSAAEVEAQPLVSKGAANGGTRAAEGAGMAALKATCEQLRQMEEALLEQPQRSMRKRIPSLIWRAFYREIRGRAAELRRLQGTPAERIRASQLEGELATVLGMAEAHLQRLCSVVQRRLSTTAVPSTTGTGGTGSSRAARRLARLHCLGLVHTMLADVERYRVVHRLGEVPRALQRAERLYRSALESFPQIGQAFNQRGLLAAYRGDHLSAVLCGFRALLCTFAFPNSKENLLVWLGPDAQAQALGEGGQCSWAGGQAQGRGSCRRSAAAIFRLHLSLLQAEECNLACMEASNATFARYEDLATCAEREIHDAVAATREDSEEGEQWLLEVMMVSVCAAVYHVRKAHAGPSSSYDPCDYSTAPTLEAAGPVGSCSDAALTGPAARAWDWVLRLGLLLVKAGEGARAHASCLAAPTLLALLCARLLPGLWAGCKAAGLREALWLLIGVNVSRGESTAMRDEESDLLQLSLPEDCLVVGLVALPPVAAAATSQAQQASTSSHTRAPEACDDDDGSDDEVVLCSPVVHTSPPSSQPASEPVVEAPPRTSGPDVKQQVDTGSWAFPMTKPAPEGSQAAARRARLRYHLGLGGASGGQGTASGCGGHMPTHHLSAVDREASSSAQMTTKGGLPHVASRELVPEASPQEGQGLFVAAHAFANTRHLITDPSPPLPPPPPPGLQEDDGCTLPNFDLGFLDDDSRDQPSLTCRELVVPPPPPSAPPPAPHAAASPASHPSEAEADGCGDAQLLLAKQMVQPPEPATGGALLMAVKGPPPGLPPPPPPPVHLQPCTPGMSFHGGVDGAGSNV